MLYTYNIILQWVNAAGRLSSIPPVYPGGISMYTICIAKGGEVVEEIMIDLETLGKIYRLLI